MCYTFKLIINKRDNVLLSAVARHLVSTEWLLRVDVVILVDPGSKER